MSQQKPCTTRHRKTWKRKMRRLMAKYQITECEISEFNFCQGVDFINDMRFVRVNDL